MDRVKARTTPRSAAQDAPDHEDGPLRGAVGLVGFYGVHRAGRDEATHWLEEGGDEGSVPLEQGDGRPGNMSKGNSWLRGFHPQVVHRMYQSMLASSSSLQRDGSFVPLEWPNRVHHGVPHSPCAQILLGRCRQLLIMIIGGNALTTRPRPAGCIMSSPTRSKMVSANVEFQNPSMVLGLCMARASACSWEGE